MFIVFLYFYVFVYKFIYVYNKQGEDIKIGALGEITLYEIHLYCSEAASRVIQCLFHDHVKCQLLWKCWDVFFNHVKGNYDATMIVIWYGLQLWILRLYALHVTHRHSNMQIGRVIIYLDITHYSLTLIQTSYTLSLYNIQYHTHKPTQICYRFVTHWLTGKEIKKILLEPISWNLNIRHLKALVLTFIIPQMAETLQALIMVNLAWE